MSKPPSPRMRKVNESLREVIADDLAKLTDPGLGFVTITGVAASPDLHAATVYYSVLGAEEQRAATTVALTRAAPRLQATLAGQLRLKYTPRLRFEVDEAIESGLRISELLRGLEDEG